METTVAEGSGPVLPSSDVEGISGSPRSCAASALASLDPWPATPYEVDPTTFLNGCPQGSAPAPQTQDSVTCQNTATLQQHQPALHGSMAMQSMTTTINGGRAPMGSSCAGDQQSKPFYTGDIADAYDESFSFWNILEQDLEPKEIKLEPPSPPWTEADSTSCSPYGSFGSYNTSTSAALDHHQTLLYRDRRPPMMSELGPGSATAGSCRYYELQPPQQPSAAASRDPMMCPPTSYWPMDLSARVGATDPVYHSPLSTTVPPQRFHHSAAEWSHHREQQQQFASASTGPPPLLSSMSRSHQYSAYSPIDDTGGYEVANGFSLNQGWHGQQGGDISPTSGGSACGTQSPTDAFLRRFPYVGSREDAMATSHQPAPEPSPLLPPATSTTSAHGTSAAQGSDGSRFYHCSGSPTDISSHDAGQTRTFHAPMPPPVTMTTLLPSVQQHQQLVTSGSTSPRYPRLGALLERPPLSQPPRPWLRHPPVAPSSLVALNGSAATVPSSQAGTYPPRFAPVPTYYNAVMQPLSVVTQAPPKKATVDTLPTSSKAQAAGQSRQHLPPHRFPRPNLTLLLTPTARPTLSTGPASILLHRLPQPSSSQFRHPVAHGGGAAAATSVHVGRLPASQHLQQASTSTATPDSATKPRRTTAERSHPAVNYALRSLKIGPFLVEVGDPNVNLGYKFKIIFSKRRFMYEFESLSPTEEEGLRLSCVIVPFQSLEALRCEHDYILVQVHSRPVMFLGRRTRKGGAESATSTSSLSDHLERYPVHKVQLNESEVVQVRHLLWQYNPRFHELMLRRISDQETKLDDPLPPYGAPGRVVWRNEVARANRASKRTPVGRRRGLVARGRAGEGATCGQLAAATSGSLGASSMSLVPFSSAGSSQSSSPSCACRVSCRVARCSCAKARTKCEPGRCSCLGCDNPLNLLEAVGIALREAQADPCLMQAVFQVSDLPWYLCQQVRLNCCPESVMVRECIPGPMPCPRCGHAAQYSWCANTLFHGSTNHCSTCIRCNLFAGEHCQACNSCYYFTGSDKNCPRCRRTRGMQMAPKRTTAASEAAPAVGTPTSTMRIVSVESLADERQAQMQPAPGQPGSQLIALPPPPLGDSQVPVQQQVGVVVEELPQELSSDPVILDDDDGAPAASSEDKPVIEEPDRPEPIIITEDEKVEIVSGDSLHSDPEQLVMDC
ncbi:LOW QUALITY PROTEIN: uncharacterized protein LOC144133120 [Amblyomma americanum]